MIWLTQTTEASYLFQINFGMYFWTEQTRTVDYVPSIVTILCFSMHHRLSLCAVSLLKPSLFPSRWPPCRHSACSCSQAVGHFCWCPVCSWSVGNSCWWPARSCAVVVSYVCASAAYCTSSPVCLLVTGLWFSTSATRLWSYIPAAGLQSCTFTVWSTSKMTLPICPDMRLTSRAAPHISRGALLIWLIVLSVSKAVLPVCLPSRVTLSVLPSSCPPKWFCLSFLPPSHPQPHQLQLITVIKPSTNTHPCHFESSRL